MVVSMPNFDGWRRSVGVVSEQVQCGLSKQILYLCEVIDMSGFSRVFDKKGYGVH